MRAQFRASVLVWLLVPALLLGAQARLPTPASVFGFEPGADFKLANYDLTLSYFRKVDEASDLVMMVDAGQTTQGRTASFALVSSKRNLERIDRYREIARRLAHPDGLTDSAARELAREGKAFVHIDGGLHSSEVAGPQHTSLLLDTIVRTADEPETKAILDNVILMLWPTINPDGHQMTSDWYMKNVGTPTEGTGLPVLYQEYVGHDNNRDAYMLNMVESRLLEYTWRQWEPSIIYVHHQSSPFPTRIWLPPFAEPIATHAPGLISSQVNMIGMAIAQRLNQEGKVGATHMGSGFDAWYPGYIDYNPVFKNIPAYWTETQGTGPAPRTSQPQDVRADMRRAQALYVSQWLGGTWHLRDAVEYMRTASMATLDYAAKYKENLLYGRYQSGRDQIARGRREAPYAYLVPRQQRDPVIAVELLRRLAFSGLRVYETGSDASIGGATYPAGTWVIPTDQEFAALAREVLDAQKYPEIRESPGGPLDQPYDAAGWTLPMSMGVTVVAAAEPLPDAVRAGLKRLGPAIDLKARPKTYSSMPDTDAAPFDSAPGIGFDADPAASAIVPPAGSVTGTGTALVLDPAQTNTFRALNRVWKAGLEAQYVAGGPGGGGRYLVSGLSEVDQADLVKTFALTATRVNATGMRVKRPRIALLNAPTSMDEGWTRWVLERYGFEFVRLPAADMQAGNLKNRIDVLLFADDARIADGGGRGGRGGGGAPGGGVPAGAAPPAGAGAGAGGAGAGGAAGARGGAAGGAIGARAGGGGAGAGGAGRQGQGGNFTAAPDPNGQATTDARIKAIDDFVRAGGTLVCFNRSSMVAVDALKLPIKNAIAGIGRQQFFVGGSLLNVQVETASRVMAGMPAQASVFYDSGPVFETQEGFKGTVLASYQTEGSPLASGFLQGENYLRGKAAALDVEHGDGHVVLLGFRPQWRGQPFGTFRVIFNALVYTK
jgi:hypothetical protein